MANLQNTDLQMKKFFMIFFRQPFTFLKGLYKNIYQQ